MDKDCPRPCWTVGAGAKCVELVVNTYQLPIHKRLRRETGICNLELGNARNALLPVPGEIDGMYCIICRQARRIRQLESGLSQASQVATQCSILSKQGPGHGFVMECDEENENTPRNEPKRTATYHLRTKKIGARDCYGPSTDKERKIGQGTTTCH